MNRDATSTPGAPCDSVAHSCHASGDATMLVVAIVIGQLVLIFVEDSRRRYAFWLDSANLLYVLHALVAAGPFLLVKQRVLEKRPAPLELAEMLWCAYPITWAFAAFVAPLTVSLIQGVAFLAFVILQPMTLLMGMLIILDSAPPFGRKRLRWTSVLGAVVLICEAIHVMVSTYLGLHGPIVL